MSSYTISKDNRQAFADRLRPELAKDAAFANDFRKSLTTPGETFVVYLDARPDPRLHSACIEFGTLNR